MGKFLRIVSFKREAKKVRCLDCGFLGIIILPPEGLKKEHLYALSWAPFLQELPANYRDNIDTAHSTLSKPYMILCLRTQYSPEHGVIFGMGEYRPEFGDIKRDRGCKYFHRYNPAFTPSEQRELLRESENRRFMVKIAAMSALIGAAVGALITALVESS